MQHTPYRKPTFSRDDVHLLVIALISIMMLAYATATGDRLLAIIAAALFAQRMIFTALNATGTHHIAGTANDDRRPPLQVLQNTTRLTALTLLWAGISLLLCYPVIGLKWQHGWQYGAGAVLLAAGFGYYAKQLFADPNRFNTPAAVEVSRKLSLAFAASIGLAGVWLVASGKLSTEKNDWLANDVFLASGISILVLAVLCGLRARPQPVNHA